MTVPIQRVPRGLTNVLGQVGAVSPAALEDRVRATLEMLQFYGQTQAQQLVATDAALASGTNLTLIVPQGQVWIVFAAQAQIVEDAAMTVLDLFLGVGFNGGTVLAARHDGVFTAGRIFASALHLPYPRVLMPGQFIGALPIYAGVATANVNISAQVGVLA